MRNYSNSLLCLILISVLFSSCCRNETDYLRERVSMSLPIPADNNKSISMVGRTQYCNLEQKLNEKFIQRVKDVVEGDFYEQLERFENEELGVFSSYANMFRSVFWGKQKWEDYWQIKSIDYFSTLDTRMKIQKEYEAYLYEIKAMRTNYVKNENSSSLPEFETLDLPEQEIYLGDKYHSRNNLFIELGTEVAGWLIALLIVSIITIFVAIPTAGTSLIATVISIILAVWLSIRNDNKLIDSIIEQHKEVEKTLDYNSLLESLNENTYEYYLE